MDCQKHDGVPAVARCSGCGAEFCARCLVTFQGEPYCPGCKGRGALVSSALQRQKLRSDASNAFKLAIVGFLVGGFVLWPIAIVKAARIRDRSRQDPSLTGDSLPSATLLLSMVGLALWLVKMWRLTVMTNPRWP